MESPPPSGTSPPPARAPSGLLEHGARRVARGRSVVLSISATLILMAIGTAVVMRIVDPDDFPTVGLAAWWALETFTTVGYGDVVPTTTVGKIVGGLMMVIGITFLSFLTASVTTALIKRDRGRESAEEPSMADINAILDGIERIDRRLEKLEARLPSQEP